MLDSDGASHVPTSDRVRAQRSISRRLGMRAAREASCILFGSKAKHSFVGHKMHQWLFTTILQTKSRQF
jgi:hypothetical protein